MQRLDKAQAVKVLEEAAELSVAVNDYRKGRGSREAALDELADVVQTLVNLCDAYGFTDEEIREASERVQRRNLTSSPRLKPGDSTQATRARVRFAGKRRTGAACSVAVSYRV